MKSLCKITKSIKSIKRWLDKLENITKRQLKSKKKQSRVEERLNELEESHEFFGGKNNNQQVQLNKISKEKKDLTKENLLLNKKLRTLEEYLDMEKGKKQFRAIWEKRSQWGFKIR